MTNLTPRALLARAAQCLAPAALRSYPQALWKRLAPFTYAAYTGDLDAAVQRLRREGLDAAVPADPEDRREWEWEPPRLVVPVRRSSARALQGGDRLAQRAVTAVTQGVYADLFPETVIPELTTRVSVSKRSSDRLARRAQVVVDRCVSE